MYTFLYSKQKGDRSSPDIKNVIVTGEDKQYSMGLKKGYESILKTQVYCDCCIRGGKPSYKCFLLATFSWDNLWKEQSVLSFLNIELKNSTYVLLKCITGKPSRD